MLVSIFENNSLLYSKYDLIRINKMSNYIYVQANMMKVGDSHRYDNLCFIMMSGENKIGK
jgi:hypothetical protein